MIARLTATGLAAERGMVRVAARARDMLGGIVGDVERNESALLDGSILGDRIDEAGVCGHLNR